MVKTRFKRSTMKKSKGRGISAKSKQFDIMMEKYNTTKSEKKRAQYKQELIIIKKDLNRYKTKGGKK